MQNLIDVGRREMGLRREGILRYFFVFYLCIFIIIWVNYERKKKWSFYETACNIIHIAGVIGVQCTCAPKSVRSCVWYGLSSRKSTQIWCGGRGNAGREMAPLNRMRSAVAASSCLLVSEHWFTGQPCSMKRDWPGCMPCSRPFANRIFFRRAPAHICRYFNSSAIQLDSTGAF